MFSKSRKEVASTTFSDFFRSASSREKKRTYDAVLKSATEAQSQVIQRAAKRA